MKLSNIVSMISTLFGAVLFLIGFETIGTTYDYNIGCTYMCNPSPFVMPEYFMMVGLIFIAFGLGVSLYFKMHPNNGVCPWCGQNIIGEDGAE